MDFYHGLSLASEDESTVDCRKRAEAREINGSSKEKNEGLIR